MSYLNSLKQTKTPLNSLFFSEFILKCFSVGFVRASKIRLV